MVNIYFYKNGFVVNGHANYDIHSKDIVCAGVSAIMIGSLNWFDKPNNLIQIGEDADLKLVIANPNEETDHLLDLLKIQVKAIESNPEYKPFIKITQSSEILKGEK